MLVTMVAEVVVIGSFRGDLRVTRAEQPLRCFALMLVLAGAHLRVCGPSEPVVVKGPPVPPGMWVQKFTKWGEQPWVLC